jgi:GH35 family endo-1,4-beta-xylanase
MKTKNIVTVLLITTILVSCAPVVTVVSPTETTIPTLTFTPVPPTATSTPIPPIETLSVSQESVNQFASAVQKAGINISVESILQQGFQIQTIINKEGKPFDIAFAKLDPDPSAQGEPFEGNYPLLIKIDNGEWERATWKNIPRNESKIGMEISQYYFRNNSGYQEAALKNSDFFVGVFFQTNLTDDVLGKNLTPQQVIKMYNWERADGFLQAAKKYDLPVRIQSIFGEMDEDSAPEWLKNMSNEQIKEWMDIHTQAISSRVKKSGVTVRDILVYNEVLWKGRVTDYISQRLGRDEAVKLGFELVQKHFGSEIPLVYHDNVAYGSDTNNPNNGEAQAIFAMVKELKSDGVKIEKVFDHAHLHSKDFNSEADVEKYLEGIKTLVEQYKSIGVEFSVNELDMNVYDANQEQLTMMYKVMEGFIELLNDGTLHEILILGGIIPDLSWMNPQGNYPYGKATALTSFDSKDRDDPNVTPTLLYFVILRALVNNK